MNSSTSSHNHIHNGAIMEDIFNVTCPKCGSSDVQYIVRGFASFDRPQMGSMGNVYTKSISDFEISSEADYPFSCHECMERFTKEDILKTGEYDGV